MAAVGCFVLGYSVLVTREEWIDAYVRLLNAPLEFYRASTERTEREGGER